MPDAYDNFKGISVPVLPWLQVFEPGQRVRITATQQLGTVHHQPEGGVFVYVYRDGNHAGRACFTPGELRPA